MRNTVATVLLLIHLSFPWPGLAFQIVQSHLRSSSFLASKKGDDPDSTTDEPEAFALTQHQIPEDTLTPPPINVRRESILFGENPATQRNNNARWAWNVAKEQLPFLLTGARNSSTADNNPWGGLYNMILVRLPVILCGLVYTKNMLEGHPLVMDLGKGPWEASPIVVYGVLYFILR